MKNCSLEVQFPSFLQKLRFVVSVLKVNHSIRYDVLKNDTKCIKCHEWFKKLLWESIIARKIKPFVHIVRWRGHSKL